MKHDVPALLTLPGSQPADSPGQRRRSSPRPGCCTPTLCATCGPDCGGRKAPARVALQAVSLLCGGDPLVSQAMTLAFGGDSPLTPVLLLGLGVLGPHGLGLGEPAPAKPLPRPVGKVRRLMERADRGRRAGTLSGWAQRCHRAGWVFAQGAWTSRRPGRSR